MSTTPLNKPRILVVDDDPVNARIAGRIARFGGFEVLETQNPAEAAALAHSWKPDLVIADVVMPGIDGSELCILLKGDPGTREIPVLLVSGEAGPDFDALGQFCGGADYLQKPYTPVKLLRTMNRLLGRVVVAAQSPERMP